MSCVMGPMDYIHTRLGGVNNSQGGYEDETGEWQWWMNRLDIEEVRDRK